MLSLQKNNINWKQIFPWLVIAVGIILELALAGRALNWQIINLLPDDAFYYFKIAQNIIAGHGSSFDGINPANGYHPLWMILILPVFKFFPDKISAVYGVLLLNITFSFLTVLMLYLVLKRFTANYLAVSLALLFWLFNPFNIFELLNGLETSVSLFFIIASLLWLLKIKNRGSLRDYIWFGIFGGLMILARLDNFLYLIPPYLWLLGRALADKNRLRSLIIAATITTIAVSPWFVWNYLNFGSLTTSASIIPTVIHHQLVIQDNGAGWLQFCKAVVYHSYNGLLDVLEKTGAPIVILLLIGFIGGWLSGDKQRQAKFKEEIIDSPVFWLFCGFALLFLLNASGRWVFRSWYFVPVNIFIAIAIAWFFDKLSLERKKTKSAVAVFAVFLLGFFFVSYEKCIDGRQINQAAMIEAAGWTSQNLPDQKVAVLNAGVHSYMSDARIINVDGLVNQSAADAIVKRRLWQYLLDNNIGYLADFDPYIFYRFKAFWGIDDISEHLKLVKTVGVAGDPKKSINIYQIIP